MRIDPPAGALPEAIHIALARALAPITPEEHRRAGVRARIGRRIAARPDAGEAR